MQTEQDFTKQLIKGKIAESIFDQMFRRVGDYTVIPFGYETIIPELKQYAEQADQSEIIDSVRNAPDFALVSHNPKQVFLIEVKYRTRISMPDIKKVAKEICDRWKHVGLFVVTPEGFYLDSCADVQNQESLTPLKEEIIPSAIQEEFKILVSEFIKTKA